MINSTNLVLEIGNPDDYYWIGLSYNKTNADGAEWRWSDGNKAKGKFNSDTDCVIPYNLYGNLVD